MEKIKCNFNDMELMVTTVLLKNGEFKFYPSGTSMLPFIREGKDQVFLSKLPEKLKKYQIVLYKRKNGEFVLHRIVKIKNGYYVMRGDHQYISENGIKREQMLGIVSRIIRDDKEIVTDSLKYRLKSAVWVETCFIRNKIRIKKNEFKHLYSKSNKLF